ncbi:EscT/YscT/HrcT family type III secretion system export apparatus protein [Acetobacter cibinongensis]|uniref:EscT/YscT/HrcT family type III secretion system export apparatus protein n=1 Tax=Acetobacter cibinongensis TaxID=146475 RepID=A0A0D6N102_9PROT|nr:type III secretion system export apparatus subunit SctT [Acetobacter cibinongensis]GAN59201.1 secretion system type III RhcT [Acetobacter cibinongensis]GBQ19256.1 type III secretion component EscT [Acetobacter cibinongensis NRIC 0482]GEL59579.1 EscT/YscT/HrcT family type III secretion system export apparatus protein [Acetobacter cibinongensis]
MKAAGGDISSVLELLGLLQHWLLALGFAMARPMGLLSIHPVFTRFQITGLLRGAMALVLALPAVPFIATMLEQTPHTGIALMMLGVKEGLLGCVLGLLLGMPFWMLDVAGDILDLQRGATQGRINDPAGFEDVSITGSFFLLLGITYFAASGGLQVVLHCLYESWTLWPPLSGLPGFSQHFPTVVLGLLDEMLSSAISLALPMLLAMLLSDIALSIVSRAAPSLRVDDHAMGARNIVFFFVLTLYTSYLCLFVRQDVARIPAFFEALRLMVGQPPA